ncbi:MAG: hypothetical protein F6K28_40990 [Microcoleus sp. SIO2G3]|nr:hypothetical protein [Microcoleus sp. SIO2G3]
MRSPIQAFVVTGSLSYIDVCVGEDAIALVFSHGILSAHIKTPDFFVRL